MHYASCCAAWEIHLHMCIIWSTALCIITQLSALSCIDVTANLTNTPDQAKLRCSNHVYSWTITINVILLAHKVDFNSPFISQLDKFVRINV